MAKGKFSPVGRRGSASVGASRYSLKAVLIERADSASALGNAGQGISRQHAANIIEIDAMSLSDEEKRKAKEEVTELAAKALIATSDNPSWSRTGRARTNAAKSRAGADKIAKANQAVASYMEKLRTRNSEMVSASAKQRRAAAVQKALAEGALFFEVDGKRYVRKSKRSKSFVLE